MAFHLSFVLAASASLVALMAATPVSAQQAGNSTELEEISVEGQGRQGQAQGGSGPRTDGAPGVATSDGYVAKATRTGTKSDTPINETPFTINTVPQKQLQDQRPQNLQEIVSYTPGAQVGLYGFDPRYDSFFIRGVDVSYTGIFRDGLRQFNSPNGLFRLEPYGLESVSILKGPASAIYGAGAASGIVDLISKRPTDYKFGEIEVQGGSYDRKQIAFDIGGPANESGTVLYRLTALARDAGTEISSVKDNRVFIAPAVTFQPTDDTKLTILGEYLHGLTGGSAAYDNVYDPTTGELLGAGSKPLAFKDFNDFRQDQGRVGYEFEHKFSDSLSIHQNARFSMLDTHQEYSGPFTAARDSGYTGLVEERTYGFAADTYLRGKVSTGPVDHKLLAGVDVSYLTYKSKYAFGTFTDPDDIPTPDFSADNPSGASKSKQNQTLVGVYAQDELALDRWRLLIGGRYDWFDSNFHNGDFAVGYGAAQKQNDGKFTGRAGLSYVLPAGFTPFVSYGTSFVPNPGTVIDGSVTKPTLGEQVEGGVKYDVPGYNASFNASVFHLKLKDGLVFAVDGTGTNRQTQLDFTSKGFELEGRATLANGLGFLANYTYSDVEIDKPESIEGKRLTGTPKHSFAVWGSYDAKQGALKGLGLGAGVRYTGQSFGDNDNRRVISNSPRAFVDAKISYEFEALDPKLKGFSAQVNATNLLDKVEQVCTSNYCYYNEGRRVIASLRYKW